MLALLWAIVTLILLLAAVATIVVTAVVFASEWVKGRGKKEQYAKEYDIAVRRFQESEQFCKAPDNAITVMCLDGSALRGLVNGVNHNCWRTDNLLHFFPHPPLVANYLAYQTGTAFGCVIPIPSILCFKREGIVTYENSRTAPETDGRHPLNQAVIAHDTRHAQLIFRDPSGSEAVLLFSEVAYYAFQHIIPEKEYKIIGETGKKPSIEDLLASMEQTMIFDDAALRREGKGRRRRTDQADQPAM